MREAWELMRLGEIADFQNGYAFKPADLGPIGIPVVRIKQLLDPSSECDRSLLSIRDQQKLDSGDIIFSWSATLAAVKWERGPALLNQHLFKVTATSPTVSEDFILLLLQSAIPSLPTHGTTMKHVTKRDLVSYEVRVPPLKEQQRIVDLLRSLDDAIEASQLSLASGRESYEGLVTAHFTGGVPEAEIGSAVQRSKDSVLVAPSDRYRIVGLERSGAGFIDRGVLEGHAIGYSRLTRLRANQLVFRKLTAWEGPISVAAEGEDGAFVSGEFPAFNVDRKVLRPGLLRHLCTSPILWERMAQRIQGSVLRRKRLNPEQLLEVLIPIAPLSDQDALLEILDLSAGAVAAAEKLLAALQQLRSELLSVLLSGAHEIPESYDVDTAVQLEPAA